MWRRMLFIFKMAILWHLISRWRKHSKISKMRNFTWEIKKFGHRTFKIILYWSIQRNALKISRGKVAEVLFVLTQLSSVSAVDIMDVVAVFSQIFGVAGIESQSVSTSLQLGHVVVAFPVFITWRVVGVESKIVRTFEVFLCLCCNKKKIGHSFWYDR